MSVRVGILSFAHVHAPQYAAVLSTLDAADFLGIADEDVARGREAAERFGVRFLEDARELFEAADAVVVCSENARHRRDVVAALEGGAHVLCEKPIATTVEDALAMIRASERTGRQLRTAFPVRYLPAVRRAYEVVRSGGVGRVLAVSGTNHGQNPGGWFNDLSLSGGGAVMDHTVHVADALRWMFGAEAASVYAEVGSLFGAEGIDDAGILTLELEGGLAEGAFATIDPSWSRGGGYPTWGDVTLRIAGTAGVLEVDAFARRLTVFDHDAGTTVWEPTGEDMNRLMLEAFVRGVEEGLPGAASDLASGLDGLRALEIALAAYRSGATGEPVPVERAFTG
ncbi:MAG: Gfo/Idh/MocA family oxidoreductase [Actinomycetota bacterium]